MSVFQFERANHRTTLVSTHMSLALTAHLFQCYGAFSDRRIKKVSKGKRFIGDTRANGGIASDGSLFGWFCGIMVEVESDEKVTVTLSGSIPTSSAVDRLYALLGALPNDQPFNLSIKPTDISTLKQLAEEIEKIVAPGCRYKEAGYKYMCPRTADSLRVLAGYLETFWAKPQPPDQLQTSLL